MNAIPTPLSKPLEAAPATARPRRLLKTLGRWYTNWRTRRQLAELPAHLLKDVGISRSDAQCEVAKPFWKD